MKYAARLIAILSLTSLVPLAGCGDTSPESRIEAARLALQNEDYRVATIELKNALQAAPNDGEARLLLGKALQAQGFWEDSEAHLRKALELGESSEQVLPLLAHVLVKMGKNADAIALGIPTSGMGATALASLLAERANALINLGRLGPALDVVQQADGVLRESGQPDSSVDLFLAKARLAMVEQDMDAATRALQTALTLNAGHGDALYLNAELLQRQGNDREAIAAYQRILRKFPGHFRAHLALVNLYLLGEDLDAATQAVAAAEKVAPGLHQVRYARAAVELANGRYKEANSAILNVLRYSPDHLPSLLIEAGANYGLGNFEKSRRNAERVLAQLPDSLYAARLVAASQIKLDNPRDAINALTPLLARHADDAVLFSLAGEAHMKLGEHAKAMTYLERASRLDPANPGFKTQQAIGLYDSGAQKRAIGELEAAAKLSEKVGHADTALVMAHLNSRDFDKALRAISAIEGKIPANPVTRQLRAAAHLGKGEEAEARKLLEQALVMDPKFFPAAASLARLDERANNPQAARKRFLDILANDQGDVRAMLALARLALAGKREKEHVEWLEKAIKAEGGATEARTILVRHYLGKRENAKALSLAREGVTPNSANVASLNLLGSTQLASDDKRGAVATFTRVAQMAPSSAEAHFRLGLAQVAADDAPAARASLMKALQLKPAYTEAEDALIRLELADHKVDAALAIARSTQSQRPNSHVGFDREGAIHVASGRPAQAVKAFSRALELGAGSAGLIKLHRALTLAGDAGGAAQRLADWVRQHPKDVAVLVYAAELDMHAGRDKAAIARFETLLPLAPNNYSVLNNLAVLYQKQNDAPRALAAAEKAFALASDHPAVMDTLGWILLRQGETRRALDLLARAAALAPGAGTLRYHHGVALSQVGKKAEARRELEAAIASKHSFPEYDEAQALLKTL